MESENIPETAHETTTASSTCRGSGLGFGFGLGLGFGLDHCEQHRDEQQLLPRELEADERRAQRLRGACGERGGAHDGDDRRRQHVAIDAEGELVGRRWGLGAG